MPYKKTTYEKCLAYCLPDGTIKSEWVTRGANGDQDRISRIYRILLKDIDKNKRANDIRHVKWLVSGGYKINKEEPLKIEDLTSEDLKTLEDCEKKSDSEIESIFRQCFKKSDEIQLRKSACKSLYQFIKYKIKGIS